MLTTPSRQFTIKLFTLALFIIAATGCGSNTSTNKTVYSVVTTGTLKAGAKIPAPQGAVILTVTGKIGTTNSDASIKMDLPMIESVGQVSYKVTDPFEKKDVTYQGVLMSDLLALWQVSKDATSIHVVALDDYSVDVPIGDLTKFPVIFALREDSQYMPVSTHGPAMLVYPYNDYQFDPAVYNNYWAWQIKSMDIR
jgi:hypothetical protein